MKGQLIMKSLNSLQKQNLTRLGDYIKTARQKNNISLRNLAVLTKVSYATISKIENAKVPTINPNIKVPTINPNILVRISSVLKLDLVKMLVLAGYFELVFRLRYEKVNQNE